MLKNNSIIASQSLQFQPILFNEQSLLANWERIGNDVVDITGVESRTVRELNAINTLDSSGIATVPGPSVSQSIDFSSSSSFTVLTLIKSNEAATRTLINNRIWSGNFNGLDIDHTGGGEIRCILRSTTSDFIQRSQAGVFTTIEGNSEPPIPANNDEWQWIAVTYDGTGTGDGIQLYRNEFIVTGTALLQGTFGEFQSGEPWGLGTIPGAQTDRDITFSRLIVYNSVKTHAEIIRIQDGELDTIGLQRFYAFEEETGAVLYNHYVTDYSNANHGSISGMTPNTFRVLDGVRSLANRKGFTNSSSVLIPVNLADETRDVVNNIPSSAGKVTYPTTVVTTSPLTWRPNPNGHAELNNLGITSATVITENSNAVFGYSELKNPLFRNRQNTRWVAYFKPLRHGADFGWTLDQFGPVLSYINKPTYLFWLGGQSNAVGINNILNGGDFVDSSYRDMLEGGYIANNASGVGTAQVTQFFAYDVDSNFAKGNVAGPDASFMHDVVNNGETEIYLYKNAVGSTSLPPRVDNINYWHPTERSGTGIPLWDRMVPGLQDCVSILSGAGRTLQIAVLWDQGESNRGFDTAVYQQDLEDLDAAMASTFPDYSSIFILRRGHNEYFTDAGFPNVPIAQDNFAAVSPNRVAYNSDSFGVWDVDDVHLNIPGQEDSGQAAAAAFLSILNL